MIRSGRLLARLLVAVGVAVLPAIAREPRQPVPRLFPFREDGKLIIRPKYDDAGLFSEGLARVNQRAKPTRPWGLTGGKWGYVDKLGREVIPLAFDKADDFRAGQAEVRVGERSFVIDATGAEIPPSRISRKPRPREDLPPELIRAEGGTRHRVNDRRPYGGELAVVHLGGSRVYDAPMRSGGAWYYVNREGVVVRRMCEDRW